MLFCFRTGASWSKCGAGESDRLPPAQHDQHENDDCHNHPQLPISHCSPAPAAGAVVRKPFDLDALERAIRRVLPGVALSAERSDVHC
jgi:hypothetical protein